MSERVDIETLRKDTKARRDQGQTVVPVRTNTMDALLDELQQARETLGKLPTHKNTGEQFVPSVDPSWALVNGRAIDLLPAHHADVDAWLPLNADWHDGVTGWYSSKADAEHAATAKDT